MSYHTGQIVPLERRAPLLGDDLETPVWHALRVAPGKEKQAAELIKRKGCDAFYPTTTKVRHHRGKRIEREWPIVSQLIYGKFHRQPLWHNFKSRRVITGVMCLRSMPIVLPEQVMRALRGLPTVQEELEAQRAELMRLRPGDKARITQGPLSGYMVNITSVKGGVAWFDSLAGLKGSAEIGTLERVLPD